MPSFSVILLLNGSHMSRCVSKLSSCESLEQFWLPLIVVILIIPGLSVWHSPQAVIGCCLLLVAAINSWRVVCVCVCAHDSWFETTPTCAVSCRNWRSDWGQRWTEWRHLNQLWRMQRRVPWKIARSEWLLWCHMMLNKKISGIVNIYWIWYWQSRHFIIAF